jgi:hypothetical protein
MLVWCSGVCGVPGMLELSYFTVERLSVFSDIESLYIPKLLAYQHAEVLLAKLWSVRVCCTLPK